MEIEYCLYSGLVTLISLLKSPLLLEISPREDVQDGLLSAIKDDELAFFYFDGRDPMAPLLDAKENRDASLQIGNQFTLGCLRIIPAKERQVAVESPGGFGELELIGGTPRGDLGADEAGALDAAGPVLFADAVEVTDDEFPSE